MHFFKVKNQMLILQEVAVLIKVEKATYLAKYRMRQF